jgi:lipooligosaccharide transport system permease protein
VVWGEILWAALLATIYAAIVALVLVLFAATGIVQLDVRLLPAILPIAFVAGCAFAAFGLAFTAIVPTIDHMNIPVFLIAIPLGLLSGTYFPIAHPWLAAVSVANPVYHLAQVCRGLLLDGPVLSHLAALLVLVALLLVVLVPLDLRLLRRRVLGD